MNMEQLTEKMITARRQWLSRYFSRLNIRQLEAVFATQGPVLILAGAGSGKTTVLINRIENLIHFGLASDTDLLPCPASPEALSALEAGLPGAEQYVVCHPVAPWKILAITFTNKAADELKSRLEQRLGEEVRDIWACTFHSACVRILRRDAEHLGYSSSFSIYDTSDSTSVMKKILKDFNLDEKTYPPRAVLNVISHAKDDKKSPEEFAAEARQEGNSRLMRYAELYREYARRLFTANAMDFDDLILNTVLLLERNPACREYWQNRFSYIMVDEYQDTNHLQFLLISLLSASHRNLCVVGDDDQSIYRFRGADVRNILSFEDQFKGCRTIRLEQNYRSTERILDVANRVIRNNTSRKEKELWTEHDRGDPVQVLHASDENDEAYRIASYILTDFAQGTSWREHAVLYRINALSSQLEFALKRAGIPYRVFGGTRFFDRAEIKDILAYLCVLADQKDELRLSRIVNVPPRGIGAKSLETAAHIARDMDIPLFEVFRHADSYPELSRAAVRMRTFADMILEIRESAEDVSVLYDLVLEKTGYLDMLEKSGDIRDQDRVENVRELKSSIVAYTEQTGDVSLDGYLSSIALYTDLDGMDTEANSVTLMTIHSAKGLEFPVVFVAGMEEGLFPGQKSMYDEAEIEEERRLCYVAVTRAKERLILSHTRQRMLYGRTTPNRPSRFLIETGLMEEPQGSSPSASGYFRTGLKASGYAADKMGAKQREDTHAVIRPPRQKEPELPSFTIQPGVHVRHTAFGSGIIESVIPMGGDFLLTIQFDKAGPKKLMQKAALRFLSAADESSEHA